jgi:hypothetical protein
MHTMTSRIGKSQYTEQEAAEELGLSVDRLRILIRKYIVTSDEDLNNVSIAQFQPSDVLLLRFLTGGSGEPQT